MEHEVERSFSRVRTMHLMFMCFAVVSSWIFPTQLAGSDFAGVIEDRTPLLWACRVSLAVLAVSAVVSCEFVLRRRKTEDRGLQTNGLPSAVRKLETDAALRQAFYAAVAIYGLGIFILSANWIDLVPFLGASLALFAWRFPRRNKWLEAAGATS